MKLIFLGSNRYQFAVEQTIMALFPSESIQSHWDVESQKLEENVMNVWLIDGKAVCDWLWQGKYYQALVDCTPETEEFALKTAVYQVLCEALDLQPPWGSLSGVRPAKLATKLMSQGKNVAETLEKDYFVDPVRAKLAEDCGKISQKIQNQDNPPLSIYVGIPFCPSRCHYCSFFSEIAEESAIEDYVQALLVEISAFSFPKISSLYLGGGTPTILSPDQLDRVLTALHQSFPEMGELTVEAGRPETITKEKLQILEKHGVERISINPQSLNQETLDKMGRNHSVEEVLAVFSQAKDHFIINMDLIAGLSTPKDFLESLDGVLELRPEQITVHSLTVKKNTILEGESPENTSENWVETLNSAWNSLKNAGYRPYYLYRQKNIIHGLENVGWALPEAEFCRYNVEMMEEFQSILGLGAGSMSKIITEDDIIRQKNHKYSKEYQKQILNLLEFKKKKLQTVLEHPEYKV